MYVDRYTRIVLTVIAASLLYLAAVVASGSTRLALSAQQTPVPTAPSEPQRVMIVGYEHGGQLIELSRVGGLPVVVMKSGPISRPATK